MAISSSRLNNSRAEINFSDRNHEENNSWSGEDQNIHRIWRHQSSLMYTSDTPDDILYVPGDAPHMQEQVSCALTHSTYSIHLNSRFCFSLSKLSKCATIHRREKRRRIVRRIVRRLLLSRCGQCETSTNASNTFEHKHNCNYCVRLRIYHCGIRFPYCRTPR